jgi:hypothetical protein
MYIRVLRTIATAVAIAAAPAVAHAQGRTSMQGFGGLTFSSSSVLGGHSTAAAVGGNIATDLGRNMQIVGEVGRLSDIKPPVFDLLDFTPADLHVSAWYGVGGVRFTASSQSPIRPYVEATAGFARMSTGVSGFGGRTGAVLDAGLSLLNRTEPMLGVGGGVLVQGGPLSLDLGYRFKQIRSSGLASVLNAGNRYQVNEVRVGVGVRF